ncbi:MAG: hypothetical protein AUK48_07575 [Oscillatoriales cyanobacterium CG2_30_44_21]|nr:MAG: hypothetical protein AUK48_07575 [Oscillatoriales cyanobacterium CG2_30_44_21]
MICTLTIILILPILLNFGTQIMFEVIYFGSLMIIGHLVQVGYAAKRHWSANVGWVLKRPFHADKKDANTSITI